MLHIPARQAVVRQKMRFNKPARIRLIDSETLKACSVGLTLSWTPISSARAETLTVLALCTIGVPFLLNAVRAFLLKELQLLCFNCLPVPDRLEAMDLNRKLQACHLWRYSFLNFIN